jgi:hypothetical protein
LTSSLTWIRFKRFYRFQIWVRFTPIQVNWIKLSRKSNPNDIIIAIIHHYLSISICSCNFAKLISKLFLQFPRNHFGNLANTFLGLASITIHPNFQSLNLIMQFCRCYSDKFDLFPKGCQLVSIVLLKKS